MRRLRAAKGAGSGGRDAVVAAVGGRCRSGDIARCVFLFLFPSPYLSFFTSRLLGDFFPIPVPVALLSFFLSFSFTPLSVLPGERNTSFRKLTLLNFQKRRVSGVAR
ncbi:hypothetical protein GGS23DRAFT_580156 [Durotheca rogersii]|uniref:uncharacterized protein n=1 Tax=Durotheca rogersii TaxID=419775 RepID=UPI00222021A1|nr:uncharacterized protein GGS23DRAFT_580156 [Durotheca rogersii]KAI5860757.1 hypothetical protein GGS23DRAFT_580156 [Durotheca rogersii]